MSSPRRPRGMRVVAPVTCLLLLLLLLQLAGEVSVVAEAATVAPAELPFTLPSPEALLSVLSSDNGTSDDDDHLRAVAPLPSHPVLILFTEGAATSSSTAVAAMRANVRTLAADVPSEVLRVHEYGVTSDARSHRLVEVLLIGLSRLPALALFHGRLDKVQIVPGSTIVTNPVQPFTHFAPASLASASYAELRTWALSELPARYMDPVTMHLVPSLQFVFNHAEVHDTLALVRDAVNGKASRSVLPHTVAMAYVRLTRRGSEETLAALSSLATQAGNAVLVLVTEAPEVAAAWGLEREHAITTAPWQSAITAYRADGSTTSAAPLKPAVQDLAPAQHISTAAELVTATSASTQWRVARAATVAAESAQLQTLERAMAAFNSTSPLRKIDTGDHLLHELASLQNALKIVFVLRESDEMWFHHHLHVATALAQRLRHSTVPFNTTTLERGAKVRRRVERAWTPAMRIDVFWLDAEQLPGLADGLHVSQVPSVLVLAPLHSRYGDGADGEDDSAPSAAAEGEGLRSGDPIVGSHTVNRYDLLTAAFTDDAQAAHDPVTGKDAAPLFPSDCDALLRFLASGSFFGAMQHNMQPTRLSKLRAQIADATTTAATAAEVATGGLPNRRYLQLDRRYYPTRLAEEPRDGPAYVRHILDGSSPLPIGRDDDAGDDKSTAGGSAAETAEQRRIAREAAAALKKKAAWEAELAKRRAEKVERTRRKAAEDAAAREVQKAAFQEEVSAALKAEAAAEERGSGGGGAGPTPATTREGLLVRRPVIDSAAANRHAGVRRGEEEDAEDAAQRLRRRRHHREYREWLADRQRMVDRCVTVSEGNQMSVMTRWE